MLFRSTAISTFLTTTWDTIKTIITTVLTAIQTVFTTIWNAIKTVITTVVTAIKTTISTIWNGIKTTITSIVNGIKTTISTVFNNILSGIKTTVGNIASTIISGFQKAITFITSLPSQALQWGKDMIMGIVNGIKSCINAVGDAVKSVADKITSFLHFSVPDEGPLTEYESWMPDFMEGLAKGINQSKGLVEKAVSGVAADMMINPKVGAMDFASANGSSFSSADTGTSIVGAIRDAVSTMSGQAGDIVIPVYLGGTMLDEVIVTASQRTNLRSGGR